MVNVQIYLGSIGAFALSGSAGAADCLVRTEGQLGEHFNCRKFLTTSWKQKGQASSSNVLTLLTSLTFVWMKVFDCDDYVAFLGEPFLKNILPISGNRTGCLIFICNYAIAVIKYLTASRKCRYIISKTTYHVQHIKKA